MSRPLSRAQLKAIVRRFRYKPGWTIRVDESGDVEVTANVMDAYHPRQRPVDPPRAYVTSTALRWCRTVDVIELIADAVQRLENHEFGEWFKYRGRRTFDPHR